MSINLQNARDFVYANGVLWERLLFGYLFERRPVEPVLAAFKAYKNSDNGFGHGLEHDIRCPDSNPLALEFLLGVLQRTAIDPGDLLDGTAHWVETQRKEDGSLANPAAVLDYPHAPWWNGGGQHIPDAITARLLRFGSCTSSLASSTRRWVEKNLTLKDVQATDWLFMNYHAHDYFFRWTTFLTWKKCGRRRLPISCAAPKPRPRASTSASLSSRPRPIPQWLWPRTMRCWNAAYQPSPGASRKMADGGTNTAFLSGGPGRRSARC